MPTNTYFLSRSVLSLFSILIALSSLAQSPNKRNQNKPYNVIFILSDDHRYDFMGFMNTVKGLKTPNMDRLAAEGVHLQNAFVTTALCSPSRASILTGQYAHTHTVVDNSAPMPDDLTFFPQLLQKAGYQTAFFGKWHMGHSDAMPQPGFDEWVSFKGQGVYRDPRFNINGQWVDKKGYMTNLLTDFALDWLDTISKDKPFFVYLSHKAVHAEFMPEKKFEGMYKEMPVVGPPSMYLTVTDSSRYIGIPTAPQTKVNYSDIPDWVRKQRYSWHGVDHAYDGSLDFEDFYRRYCETLMSVDESIGRVMDWLEKNNLDENTLVIYMGDNGFQFGEHGLIDKRDAYEASMRVPLLAWCPTLIDADTKISEMVENIDVAPTILDLADVQIPENIQGRSFLPLLKGKEIPWRHEVFYEYYWEWAFPQTPTMFAVRTDRYKYIYNWGVWDINELYDLQKDPYEMNNLIRDPEYQDVAKQLKKQMWDWLEETKGMSIPLKRVNGKRIDLPYRGTY